MVAWLPLASSLACAGLSALWWREAAAHRKLRASLAPMQVELAKFRELGVDRLALEKSELAAIIDSMTEGLVIYDMDFNPVLTNPALHQMAQAGTDKTAVLNTQNLFVGRYADPAMMVGIEEAMKAHPDRPRTDTVDLVRPDQWLKRYSTPLYNADRVQVGHLVIFRDVTPEMEVDQMRQEFIANASHELRTPVTSMKALIESLMEGAQEDPELRRTFLNDVYREANRLHGLVNELLDLAHLESGKEALRLQDMDARRVIKEAIATVSPQARQRDIVLEVRIPQTPVPLRADRVRLRQILVNLLANAVKYTPAGGQVTLEVTPTPEALGFKVADTGIGIPQADLPHIFDRFFRVTKGGRSRLQGGSGLGLTLVKQAVEAHRGEIAVDSVEGEGTVVSFKIPRLAASGGRSTSEL